VPAKHPLEKTFQEINQF